MACRIQNLGKHRLALDLRGGGVIYLNPNEVSPPMREELLYDHMHLPQWLAQGLVRRTRAKMAEVFEYEQKAAAARPGPAPPTPAAAGAEDVDQEAALEEIDSTDTDDGSEGTSGTETSKTRRRAKDTSRRTRE
jgi:hypothetical protein